MKTSSTMVFLGTTALTGAIVAGSSMAGCRSSDTGPSGTGASATTTTTTSTGGAPADGPVNATVVTIQQIVDPTAPGHVGVNVPITLQGVVAMSVKFLVSKSSSGSCLWGVFLSAPGLTQTAASTGILALSYGTPASVSDGGSTAYCPVIQPGPYFQSAGDSFPDDIAPGDVIDLTGVTDAYVPAACAAADAGLGASQVPSYQISKVTTVTTHPGKATVPTPYLLTSTDMSTLAAGTDATWLDQWANVLVEVQNVTAQSQGGTLFDKYGHMVLTQDTNGIQVGDKIYYQGEAKLADACYGGPYYPLVPPVQFNSITGFVYLDYCNYGLDPHDKCHDLNPPSYDCLSVVEAEADAGADAGSDASDAAADASSDASSDASDDASADAGDGGLNPANVCLH